MNDEMRIIHSEFVEKDRNLVSASKLKVASVAGSSSVFPCDMIVVTDFSCVLILSCAKFPLAHVADFCSFVIPLVLIGHYHPFLFEEIVQAVCLIFEDLVEELVDAVRSTKCLERKR